MILRFSGRTDAEAEIPVLWPPDAKYWLIGKDPDAGKDWREQKGITGDEMVRWHPWLNGHEFEQAPGVGDGQGSLALHSDMTEQLNWTEKNDTNKEAENRSRLIDRENNLTVMGGGRDKPGVWD